MSLKANNILEVKNKFNFEAPILSASVIAMPKRNTLNYKSNKLSNSKTNNDLTKTDRISNRTKSINQFNKTDGNNPIFKPNDEIRNDEKIGITDSMDLNQTLAPNPKNLYIVKVNGQSMIDENIYDGDLLIVDKNETPKDGKIIIAVINGELLVKIFRIIENKVFLISANSKFLPLEVLPDFNFQVQGVVKHVIHEV